MNKNRKAKFTIERVYLTAKPLTVNSPSLPPPASQSSDGDEFTEEKLEEALKKVSRPNEQPKRAEGKK